MTRRLVVFAAVAASLANAALQEPISVDGGQITGTPSPLWTPGVRLFRGVPYAAPLVGNLRWRAPEPVVSWKGVLAADHFSAACMQAPSVHVRSWLWSTKSWSGTGAEQVARRQSGTRLIAQEARCLV